MLGSLGVVFGDIGTSPIYGFRTALTQVAKGGLLGPEAIIGVVSLILWALTIVVTIKYVAFLMRADNRGEGGILSLMALAQRAVGRTRTVLVLGVFGVALFYGDASITPAISVLSAVEGLKTAPGLADQVTPAVEITIALALLTALFMIQSRGTAVVGRLFGPTCLVWFIAIGLLGAWHLGDSLDILWAFNPWHGLKFLLSHGIIGMLVLGAVSLTVTGAEALYADMGHFGRGPITWSWALVVFPALALNYLGQGAFALHFLGAAAGHATGEVDQNWFFLMVPSTLRIPMVVLVVAATLIASQAVISGAYSLSSHAMQLGLLPRLRIMRTSETEAGQIYLPTINLLLMIGVVLLVGIFKNSDALADAYGFAVTGTMAVTTMLAAIVVRRLWKWNLARTALVTAPLILVDLALFGANSLKLMSGGWVPLTIALCVIAVIFTWMRGSRIVSDKAMRDRISLADFLASLRRRPRPTVKGVAVFLSSDATLAPSALLHNLKHNGVLHERNVIVTVSTADTPRVAAADRATFETLETGFERLSLSFGFMERPDVPGTLAKLEGLCPPFDPMTTSYFLGRRTIVPSHDRGLRRLQDLLFSALSRNSADPSEVFSIPPGRVIEMGVQVAV